jgi:hypothetical protein
MRTVILVVLVVTLFSLALALTWHNIEDTIPSPTPEPLASDLFGQPIAETGSAAPHLEFPPKPHPKPDSSQSLGILDSTLPPQAQDMFIGPLQPFKTPEIIAYA